MASAAVAAAQTPAPSRSAAPPASPAQASEIEVPRDYVIGPDDVLSIVFWKEPDMSADVTVRPDGKITLPQLNDQQAAGLTPEQLRDRLIAAAKKTEMFVEPEVMVRVRDIKSRFVTIVGEVNKQGPVPIGATMSVFELLGLAGGLTPFADAKNIRIFRTVDGETQQFKFNFNDFKKGKNPAQNIQLKVGDQVVVP
jgi:polysaccharide export outer membrane protein